MFAIQMQQLNHSLNVHLMNLTSMDVQNLSIRLEVSLMRQTSAEMSLSYWKKQLWACSFYLSKRIDVKVSFHKIFLDQL